MMLGTIDWAAFVQKLYSAMDKKINDMIYAAFLDADKYLPTEYVKSGSITQQEILDLASELADVTGREIMIVGTHSAMNKLYSKFDMNWVSEQMKDERNSTGRIGVVNGFRTMTLAQAYEAGTRRPLLDNSKLMLVPVDSSFKPIKLVNEGDSYFNEVTDRETNMDMTVQAEYMQKFGVGVVINMYYGIIKEIA